MKRKPPIGAEIDALQAGTHPIMMQNKTSKSKILQDRAKELGIPCIHLEVHQRDTNKE